MSRLSFALTIAVLFAAVVVLSIFVLQKLFVSGPDNEDFADATRETTQATETTQETTAYGEETTAYLKEETTALQGVGERTTPLKWTDNLAEHNVSIKRYPGSPGFVMLRFDGIIYDYARGSRPPGGNLDDEDLGPKLAELNLEGNKQSTNSTTTTSAIPNVVPVYAIKGYDTSFRLAARMDDGLIMFEVLSNPKANEASDVLDIGGKVSSISIAHWGGPVAGGGRVGSIEDPEKVQRVVQGLMDAPLKPTGPDYYGTKNPNHFFIYFELKDGGVVGQNYRMDTGRLSKILSSDRIKKPASGVVVPQAFREAIKEGAQGFLKQLKR